MPAHAQTSKLSIISAGSVLLVLSLQPAAAQGTPNPAQAAQQIMPGDVTSAAQSAAQTLTSSAQDKLLVKDLLGAQVKEPGGNTVGTVEDLVVIPGGRVIAAIVSTNSQSIGRIPVPFSVAKLTAGSGKPSLNLPVTLSELQNMKEIQQLRGAIPGMQ